MAKYRKGALIPRPTIEHEDNMFYLLRLSELVNCKKCTDRINGWIASSGFVVQDFSPQTKSSETYPITNLTVMSDSNLWQCDTSDPSGYVDICLTMTTDAPTIPLELSLTSKNKPSDDLTSVSELKPNLPVCDIDIIENANELSIEDFVSKYVGLKRPVILRGLLTEAQCMIIYAIHCVVYSSNLARIYIFSKWSMEI